MTTVPVVRWTPRAVICLLGLATAYAALQTLQIIVVLRTRTTIVGYASDIFRENLTRAYIWSALTPLVFWLGARFRVDAQRWPVSVPALLAGSLVVAFVHVSATAFAAVHVSALADGPVITSHLEYRVRSFLLGEWVLFWIILGIGYLLDYYRRARDSEMATERLATRAAQLEADAARARLRALQMELDPHFLFNVLNGIGSLVRQGDAPRAVNVISKLGDFLRRGLARDRNPEVPLAEEIASACEFLELERLRFDGDLEISVSIGEGLGAQRVPVFILQPLVENAARHGLTGPATKHHIQVSARADDGSLVLGIADSGLGFPYGAVERIGLTNTRRRLEDLYADRASLRIGAAELGGALVEVRVPLSKAVAA